MTKPEITSLPPLADAVMRAIEALANADVELRDCRILDVRYNRSGGYITVRGQAFKGVQIGRDKNGQSFITRRDRAHLTGKP